MVIMNRKYIVIYDGFMQYIYKRDLLFVYFG